jgi:predicted phosphoribosyltransferase/dienelactone hydrolase
VIVVRKLGVPHHAELAMGAIGEDGVRIVAHDIVRLARVNESDFAAVEAHERLELARRVERFRGGADRISLEGRTALIVDDGIATGSTVMAACQVARAHGAARVVVAAPIAPQTTVEDLRRVADDVVVLASPLSFHAIGQFYDDFSQTSDDEVVRVLARARMRADAARSDRPAEERGLDEQVAVDAGPARLAGDLRVPRGAGAIVLFAHGSGSSRHSSRNRFVADLFDLLTAEEERDRSNVFDIELLAERLVAATTWVRAHPAGRDARIGYFGASTGAAAALWASVDSPVPVSAIVSRGGRPDLAAPRLAEVRAPTLLVVGGNDREVLELNRQAAARMRCEKTIRVVPRAGHLFEEPGTLAEAAGLAQAWFAHFLAPMHQATG